MKKQNFIFISCLILMLSPLIIPFQFVGAAKLIPMALHLSWQHDTTTTMTASWRTVEETESIVQYGLDVDYGKEVVGTSGLWHHVELTGLTPDTIYHYRVGDGKTWSPGYTFKTGTTGKHTRFIGFGDSQSRGPLRKEVTTSLARISADFSICSGDFVEMGAETGQWNTWFEDFGPFLYNTPIMVAMGNHEKNHSNYYDSFALPGNEVTYSFNYGPIHCAVLDTRGVDYTGDFKVQAAWLTADLEAHKNYDWTIVMLHRPPFSCSIRYHKGYYENISADFVPVFEQYDVDLVLSGHEHLYERLEKNNITYIISGGAGTILSNVIEDYVLNISIYVEKTLNYLVIDVYENQFDVRGVRPDYSLIDQYTVNKVSKPDLRCENLPLTYTHLWDGTQVSQDVNITIANNGEVNITESTRATVHISDGTSWDITVPPLDAHESVMYQYEFTAEELGEYTWTVTVDVDEQIDEVIEENNVQSFMFKVEEPEKSSFIFPGIWGIFGALSALMATAVLIKKRKKKE